MHPGHVSEPDSLLGFLSSEMKFSKALIERLTPEPVHFHSGLPGTATKPLPSIELAQQMGQLLPGNSQQYGWHYWEIQGLAIARPLLFLKEVQYAATTSHTRFNWSSDLGFWTRYAQIVRSLVASHQFLPMMKCYLPTGKGKAPQIISGWSPASERYDNALDEFARSMPGVCRTVFLKEPALPKTRKAGKSDNDRAATAPLCLSARGLLRHFSEQQLEDLVINSRFSATQLNQLGGNWPGSAMSLTSKSHSPPVAAAVDSPDIDIWKKWRAWQQLILGRQEVGQHGETTAKTGFVLGLRLQQPSEKKQDWRLDFLVSATDDPSLQVTLGEWWDMPQGRQSEWRKYFGE